MKYLLILIISFLSTICLSQNKSIDALLNYYYDISTEDLLFTFENEHRSFMDSLYSEVETLSKRVDNNEKYFDFRQGIPILVLETFLSENIENYNYDDDILKYFDFSHSPNNLLLADNSDGSIIAFVKQKPLGPVIYTNDRGSNNRKYFRRLSKLISKALNHDPDAIIINSSLGLLTKNSPFIVIIKNSQAYVYEKNKRRPTELNEFVRKNFDVESIRRLSKWSDVFSNPDLIIIR